MAEPEWRRVAEEIRQRIRQQDVIPLPGGGHRLPRYDDLIVQHRTSYGTLRTVLLVLEAEGWIVRRHGVDLLVREDHPE